MSLGLFLRDLFPSCKALGFSYDHEHSDLKHTSSLSKSSSWYDGAYKNVSKCLLVEAKGSFYAYGFKQLLGLQAIATWLQAIACAS